MRLFATIYIYRGIICDTSASLPQYTFTRGKNFGYDCDIVMKLIFPVAILKFATDFEFP